jgi:hypothetical protein
MAQMMDSISFSAIYLGDLSLGEELRFLRLPFGVQNLSLELNQFIHSPIADISLRKDIDDFVYAHYLPILIHYQNNTKNLNGLRALWPGHARILSQYSSRERSQWEGIKSRLLGLLDQSQGAWTVSKSALTAMSFKENDWDDQVMASMIRAQAKPEQAVWLKWARLPILFFPYIYGWAQFCLYAAFPFLMLALLVFCRMSIFMRYIEILLWIKSWLLCASGSYYVSLLAARVQGQGSGDMTWFWEYPYYVALTGLLIVVTPIVSFIAIHQVFELCINRSS